MTGLLDLHHLRGCRAAHAEARIAVSTAKDAHEYQKALAEQRAGHTGRNESERKTALLVALASDQAYQLVLTALRAAEAKLVRAEAELETAQDQRRAEEWQVRLALVNALDRASVPSDAPGDDTSFDDTADEIGIDLIQDYQRAKERHAAYLAAERGVNELFA